MWWIILIAGILLPVIYVVFAPLYLEIDSDREQYRVRLHRLASMRFIITEDALAAVLKIGWWQKNFILFPPEDKNKKAPEQKTQPASYGRPGRRRRKFSGFPEKLKGLMKSFRVIECEASIDTGSPPMNGILFPLFYLWSLETGTSVMINFYGENRALIKVRNSVARLMVAYLRS